MAGDLRLPLPTRGCARIRFTALALMAALVLGAPARAQETRQLAAGAQPAKASLENFAWIAGRWTGDGLGGKLEEVYSPPAGGVMLGHFQATDEHGAAFFELIAFREESGPVMLRLRHFNPDLHAWENKAQTVDFPLVAIEGNRFFFSGLTIERVSNDETRHFILLKNKDGTLAEMQTHYHRVR